MTASALLNLHILLINLTKITDIKIKVHIRIIIPGKTEVKKDERFKKTRQIAIGVGCILVSVLLVFYGISQPKVNETPLSQLQDTLSQTSIKTSSSDKNDASFKNSGADTQTTVLNSKSSQPSSAHSVSYPVNLNTCTYEDFVSIDGIGDTKAQAILEYRDYLGGYTNVSQLKEIKGIGTNRFIKFNYFTAKFASFGKKYI